MKVFSMVWICSLESSVSAIMSSTEDPRRSIFSANLCMVRSRPFFSPSVNPCSRPSVNPFLDPQYSYIAIVRVHLEGP